MMLPICFMNVSMLDLDLVRTFVAVVEAGGFTRAGERMNRTQSTVSQQVRRLEDDLGRRLIERDRAGGAVVPTDEGEILLGYARRLLDLSSQARAALLNPGAVAVVRLGVPEDFSSRRLTGLLSGFPRTHAGLRLDTTSGWSAELCRLLEGGDLDLALIKRDVDEGRCLGRWPERLLWVAGRDADIAVDPLPLALFPQGCIYRRRAVDAVEALGRRWRVAYVGQGLAGVQAAVASGIGMGLLASDAVQRDHRRLGPTDGFPDPPVTEVALVARSGRMSSAVGELVEYLIDRIGPLLEE